MAKKPKQFRPFFPMRFEINDTLEALAHELLVTIQSLEVAIDHGNLSPPIKKQLQARLDGLKAVCSSRD